MKAIAHLIALLACLCACLLVPAGAGASLDLLGGFHLSSPVLFVNENAGDAVITVSRSDTSSAAWVSYGAWPLTATPYQDYVPVKGALQFARGQSTAAFSVPIIDHGIPGLPLTLTVGLYGASTGLSLPSSATLVILQDDPISVAPIASNPLALSTTPPTRDPLDGARFFVDPVGGIGGTAFKQALVWSQTHPTWAGMLGVIANEPQTQRFGAWNGADPGLAVQKYLETASIENPGTVPLISTYRVVHGGCGDFSDSPADVQSYESWITSFAQGIHDYRAVVFLEMDSLITTGCLSRDGLNVRMQELRFAIAQLAQDPRVVVYLDAGAADALPARRAAGLLKRAGVARIQGFFLNATHFDWTSHEIRYGEEISRLTGGKHFVVNTAENGRGPLIPRNRRKFGNEVLCNPPGRGLGPFPTADTGYPNVDAFAWIGNPGRSGGTCRPGAPPTGVWWPDYALMLVRNADFRVR